MLALCQRGKERTMAIKPRSGWMHHKILSCRRLSAVNSMPHFILSLSHLQDDEEPLVEFLSWRPPPSQLANARPSSTSDSPGHDSHPHSHSHSRPHPQPHSHRPPVFYDPKFALRVCLERRRMRGCVCVYSLMGMHQEAMSLALKVWRCKIRACCVSCCEP